MNRRNLIKGLSLIGVGVTIPVELSLTGCPKFNSDVIVQGLTIADGAAKGLIPILNTVDPSIVPIVTKIEEGLALLIKTYKDFEDALPADKPSKAAIISATSNAITTNLSSILNATGLNGQTLFIVQTAVTVINSAIQALLTKIPASAIKAAGKPLKLPVMDPSTTPNELKDAWNKAVKKQYPSSVIK